MNEKNPDPTKHPEFQKVIRHFVTTAPMPHEEMRARQPAVPKSKKNKQTKNAHSD
jgi:hypothetical protein